MTWLLTQCFKLISFFTYINNKDDDDDEEEKDDDDGRKARNGEK